MTGPRIVGLLISLIIGAAAMEWGYATELKGGLLMMASYGAGIIVGALGAWDQASDREQEKQPAP